MKRKQILLMFIFAIATSAMIFQGCKKDDEPKDLTLATLLAGTVDLNGATSPNTVPVDASIVATFSTDIDAATVSAANIKLTQDYDNTDVQINITASGKTMTITPVSELGTGTLYKLSFSGAIMSTDAKPLTAFDRTFTTIGTFAPTGAIAHWNFEDNANDIIGTYNSSAAIDVAYVAGRNASAGKAASFNGTTSIIEIPNGDVLMTTPNFTISFWVKAKSEGQVNENGDPKGHFVMGLGAFYGFQFEIFGGYDGAKFAIQYGFENGQSGAEDMWFPALATDASNGGWQGWDFAKSLTAEQMIAKLKDNWLHVTYTYDGTAKKGTLYYDSEKMKSFDFNLWPEGDLKRTVTGMKYAGTAPDVVNELAFGFVQSRAGTMWDAEPWGGYDIATANHFRGQLDDVRIFHKVLTTTEIQLMYNSEKP
ncbi:MAG: hypothetical protein CVT92_04410 [Bacteroidetes bacterium HGW-Bacteroidetes-1]|jgi:hypothetical protein|nr:MAG: hypothetical protein CVT92_04410 [Bacteroidetes bacterium HGW-Bacteroidetes-1]